MKKVDYSNGHYGWTAERIQARLKMFGLDTNDHLRVKRLQENVIAPHGGRIIGEFYRFLGKQAGFKRVIAQGFSVEQLKATQTRYLHTLGVGFDSRAYFEERTRIGAAHARAQVPLSLYQAAYSLLQRLLLRRFPGNLQKNLRERDELTRLVLKLTALDMSLAIETYHRSEVQYLEKSLSSLRAKTSELQHQVDLDPLTGLVNHTHALAILKEALSNAHRDGTSLCVLMTDLDHFKNINDRYGHLVGDGVLRDVATRMRSAVRDFDSIGRYGGEEFIVILSDTPMATAKKIAERVRRRVGQTPVQVNRLKIPITVSLGLTLAGRDDDSETLIGRADAALYDAKNAGRNRVEIRRSPAGGARAPVQCSLKAARTKSETG